MAQTKKNKTSIGCLFWIALILLVLVIFLFNRQTIQNVLDETGFVEIIQKDKEDNKPEVKNLPSKEEEQKSDKNKEVKQQIPSAENTIEVTATETDNPQSQNSSDDDKQKEVVKLNIEPAAVEENHNPEETIADSHKVRKAKMYFIQVLDSGAISLKSITRPVYYIDSPLTETMKTLLEGLSASELNKGLITLIPDKTKLLSISVKNGVAYINFSESFRFNSFGVEGYEAQIKQIVYTATEFSSVSAVQFMIEGKIEDYMGTEGVYIGKPLSRSSL